jgi:aminopeptidase N
LVLDLDPRLTVTAVRLNRVGDGGDEKSRASQATSFDRRGGKLWIFLNDERSAGEHLVTFIEYSGQPRVAENAPWDGGFTWAKTKSGDHWVATSNQGEGADLWWPCKDHPSDKPESVTLMINVPRPLVVASNGRLMEVLEAGDGTRTFHWHTSFPISNYNVALNIAPYEMIEGDYTSVTGETVPVTYWVLPENKKQGQGLFPELLEHLNFYERTLGPYPFRGEKYGVAETPHLGMEHQSIIAYGNKYRGGPHGYDWLHHHELGHEWWGNLVTVPDWRHFWIHEGLCTYMQNLYAEEREGNMAYHHAMYANRQRVNNENPIVPAKPAGMHAMGENVGNDVYFKGSWVIHMMRYLVGKETTLEILRRFAYPDATMERSTDGRAIRFADTDDFVALAEVISGQELGWLFDLYLRQPELPELISTFEGDRLVLQWQTPDGYPFPMPLEIEVDGEIRRLEMPAGRAELDAGIFHKVRLDPNMWILKADRLIEVER